jgi:hypothetical protein
MSIPYLPPLDLVESIETAWGTARYPAGCAHCGQVFLLEEYHPEQLCPTCAQAMLQAQPALLRQEPPELLIPFRLEQADLRPILEAFVKPVWLPCADFTPDMLLQRVVPVYWPMWLVDSDIVGHWEAEVGFDYKVKSSQESYSAHGWQSHEVIETRVRWEPRVGQLQRRYENIAVPALHDQHTLAQHIGPYQHESAIAYHPSLLNGATVRVPDLQPRHAWPEAQVHLAHAAADECRRSTDAQHIRSFTLSADYEALNWTQRLHPLYVTYYTDDQGQRHPIYLNGQSGAIGGLRLASQRRGWRYAGIIAAVAGVLLLVGVLLLLLGSMVAQLQSVGMGIILLSVPVGLAALVPALWPWQWNRQQQEPPVISRSSPQ